MSLADRDRFWKLCIQDAVEYAECEAAVKAYPPFIEAMRRRGVDDMELVMVDPWYGSA